MKVAIYYRVSTSQQDLGTQRAMLPAHAKQKDWEVYRSYEDDAISGSTIEARPDFKRLLKDMQEDRFEVLLVQEISRVTRAESAEERGRIIDLLLKHRIILAEPSGDQIDPNTPSGEKYLQDAFWAAKQERKAIATRMFYGREEKMNLGIPMFHRKMWGRECGVLKHSNKDPRKWEVQWRITDQNKIDQLRRGGQLILEKRYGWRRAAEEVGITFKTLRKIIVESGGSVLHETNAC